MRVTLAARLIKCTYTIYRSDYYGEVLTCHAENKGNVPKYQFENNGEVSTYQAVDSRGITDISTEE
jgi:hypothetical protein